MNTIGGRQTAKIYEFPKARIGTAGVRNGVGVAGQGFQPFPAVELGGAWYHEAAVREASQRPVKP